MSYAVTTTGQALNVNLQKISEQTRKVARMAINRTADKARTESAKLVRQQVNFPASYVSPSSGRLAVSKRATDADLTAKVSARKRPTSLARFATKVGRNTKMNGVNVVVKPGVARYMRSAFLINLRSGSELDTKGNYGLAVRTKGNVKPSSAYRPVQMRNGLWLLYGPSVSQALLNSKGEGIWDDNADKIATMASDEIFRLLELEGL